MEEKKALLHQHRVLSAGTVRASGHEDRAREALVVGRVREVLGLQAEARVLDILPAALARQCPIQEVARVELNPWLIRPNFQHASRRRIMNPRGGRVALRSGKQHIVQVVADSGLFATRRIDPVADNGRLREEVVGGVGDRQDLAGREQIGIALRVALACNIKLVIENGPTALEVKVGMIGKIHGAGLVGRGCILHAERVGMR